MSKTLTIRYTSDTHGYLYPTSYADMQDRPMGLMKLASEYPHDGNTLIIDGGDTIQGSPLTNLYQRLSPEEKAACLTEDTYGTHPIAAMMNLAGYQFVTLGNHDFNYGVDALLDYLTNLDALCLCANIRDKEGRLPIAPYAVHQLENGLRVGLVGVCTHFVRRWENPKTVEQLVIEEPVPAAKAALEAVKPLCDLTVLIYHGGFECDLETGKPLTTSAENQACRMCRELDFDLVLTGHQHMRVDGVHFGNSFAVQPAYRAPHCCGVTVTVEDDGSKRFESRIIPADGRPLESAYNLLMPLEKRVQTWLDTPAGHLNLPLASEDHLKAAVNGSCLANFINTVQLEASGAADRFQRPAQRVQRPADRSHHPRRGFHLHLHQYPRRAGNDPPRAQAVHRAFRAYFDHDENGSVCISGEFLRPKVQHYNYDFFSGIDYTIDVRKPVGQRVTSIVFEGHELGEDEPVTVCINSYRFCGTGGYDMLPRQKVAREVLTDVADAMIDYITTHPDIHVDTHRYCTVIG